jgi:hypothetical protein
MNNSRQRFVARLDDTLARALSHAEDVLRSYGATEDEVAEELARLSAEHAETRAKAIQWACECVYGVPPDKVPFGESVH